MVKLESCGSRGVRQLGHIGLKKARREKPLVLLRPIERWAVLWRSDSALDGPQAHFEFEAGVPKLFHTRRDARGWVQEKYGYIKDRPDLQAEPHGWKMPLPMRVSVILEPCGVSPGAKGGKG